MSIFRKLFSSESSFHTRFLSNFNDIQLKNVGDKIEKKKEFTKEELKNKLNPLEYEVTQNHGTERAFSGSLYNEKREGVYTCKVCDKDLFTSGQKFDSGSGWPSFFDAIKRDGILYIQDNSYGMNRIEVRCGDCNSHLGHLFNDGPKPTGLRYCINSVSLNFNKKQS